MTAASITPLSPERPILQRRGLMLIIASPPGGGKTTITREIARLDPHTTISVSATTRAKRHGETEGKHYFFVTPEKFTQMTDGGKMLEVAKVYGRNMYGTPKAPVERALSEGRDVLFDIDWQGNRTISAIAGEDVVSVFLLPPSWGELERRLYGRDQDSKEEIVLRLGKARDEISHYNEFNYVIVNNDLDESVHHVRSILDAERHRRNRLTDVQSFVDTLKPST